MIYEEHPLIPNREEVTLNPEDIPQLRRLFKYLLRTNSFHPARPSEMPKRLSTALFHFDASTEGMKGWTEATMELTVALEILFDVDTELRFRLATRVAQLLGVGDEDTKNLYRHVQAMYDARSFPAHGKQVTHKNWEKFIRDMTGKKPAKVDYRIPDQLSSDEVSQLNEATGVARDIVRRALLACMRLSESPDTQYSWPLPGDIDARLLTTERRGFQRIARAAAKISF
jgi:hypothetical protein